MEWSSPPKETKTWETAAVLDLGEPTTVLVASLLLVVRPGAPLVASLLLVAMPFVTSSFLLLVAMASNLIVMAST